MRVLISRASVAKPWRIITAIHTRDQEKDLHMKGQTEAATVKKEGDLEEHRPENVQDWHHYPHLPHPVTREAEHLPTSQAEVLKIHKDSILLQAEIRDVTEERLQDDRVSFQVCDGEFPEYRGLEAIFFIPEPDMESKWQPHSNLKLHQEVFQQEIKRCSYSREYYQRHRYSFD